MEKVTVACLDWAVATAALAGETESGDCFLVRPRPDGALVAAIDGLGHGSEASAAAKHAIEALQEAGELETSLQLMQRCHKALAGTRGVVMSLGIFRPEQQTLTWIGVGNVEGVLVRHDGSGPLPAEPLVSRGGVIGDNLPPLRAALLPVNTGDLLVFVTDGISANFEESIVCADSPQVNADRILAKHNKRTDDALVVVARYLGSGRAQA
jgi:serine phosphatase RsbU (regulator of sigma subunit)